MMQQLLSHWPWAVAGQALGMALAWQIDAILWTWRRFEIAVFAANLFGSIYLLAVALAYFELWQPLLLQPMNAEKTFIPPLVWLLTVTCVQAHQQKIGLRAAFFAALMNFLLFGCAIHISSTLLFLVFAVVSFVLIFIFQLDASSGFGVFGIFYLGTASIAYALLSLFRPSIRGMWHAWRQNSEKA